MSFTPEQQAILNRAKERVKVAPAAPPEKSWGEALMGSSQDKGILRTTLDQSLQGATFGAADEITDRLGAYGASLITGEDYGTVLEDARAASKKRLAQQLEQRPALSIGSNIVGGIATGGAATTTKTGKALADSLRAGGVGARTAKGAAAGASSGALYGVGTGEGELSERVENAGFDKLSIHNPLLMGGVFGGAAPGVVSAAKSTAGGVKTAAKGARARGADELDDALGTIRDRSNTAYQTMRNSGATLTKQASQQLVGDLRFALNNSGPINKRLHGNTVGVFNDLQRAANQGKLGLEQIDQFRQLFGEMSGDIANKSNARVSAILRDAIDDSLESFGNNSFHVGSKQALDSLKAGRAEFSKSRKFEMIADVVKKSQGDANYVKRELTKILNNPKKSRAFKGADLETLKEAARLGVGEVLLKIAGKFGFDGARLGAGVGAGVGSLTAGALSGGTAAAIVPAAGTAARYGQKLLTRGKTEKLLQTIEGAGKQVSGGHPTRQAVVAATPNTPLLPAAGAITSGNIAQHAGGTGKESSAGVPATVAAGATAGTFTPEQQAIIDRAKGRIQAPAAEQPITGQDGAANIDGSGGGDYLDNYLDYVSQKESGGNPNAKNPNSTASGEFQFIDSTWNNMVAKYGKDYGITRAMKNDPKAQRMMAKLLAQENAIILTNAIGRDPTPQELYLAHFAGPNGAKRILTAPDNAFAANILPKAAMANKRLFFANPKGTYPTNPLTVAQFKQILTA